MNVRSNNLSVRERKMMSMKLVGTIFVLLQLQLQLLLYSNNYGVASAGCIDMERRALLQLKASLVENDINDLLPSWDNKSYDCCEWKRVGCSNQTGHVEMLHLYGDRFGRFRGDINASLLELRQLKYLNLSYNRFSNSKFPELFGSLSNLRFLDLRASFNGGRFPNDISRLSNLQYLDLSYNILKGTIPHQFGNLSHLQYLDLSWNDLVGTIPHQLGSLSNLQYLDLGWNLLSDKNDVGGEERLFKNNKLILRSIDLSSNQLIGNIPEEIGNLVELVSLNLSSNNLSGEITSKIGKLKLLEFLDLSRNQFSGLIPPSLAQIDRLSMLNLSYNNLFGRIPIGTQLQGFDPSSYEGNVGLCGKPLVIKCPGDEKVTPQKPETPKESSLEDKKSIYLSVTLGFITGFWGLWGSLLFIQTWRHAYVLFLNNITDTMYVFMVLNATKFQRWLRALLEKFV
ncbi:uncharacterized protein [Cicer arietinum]|uniref:Receptor-like protein EIX2 isoform X2 n=1 Tax=Cicer arietinum TaxID=3827 RepID=A0A1S3DZJ9_CICAR|nr:receptor-like protein EIX2 isoform X2 [Cicer arietinum]